ncbi:MAG TPA: sulfite exporter TauE/SafE family protein [Victivallales bacterium]|nr:sulfite exporter TauE/SafE family protein [Victivallales bacterium]HPO89838.1 sulfite exporter TauE/SafE family protein [Victivallales bacterium]HRR27857.1 sulfite exporter TauE/SafE family protein [Victivallales bacterium]HRU00342.1 sulfite exporter TauE/SafE family protein [Victivallales bacterium]
MTPQSLNLIFWGIIAGIAGGALGIGGGALVVPILVLIFGLNQKSAQGLSLMAMIPMAIVGSLRYYFNPDIEINPKIAFFISIGSIIGVLIGSEIAARLPSIYLKKAFAIFLVIIAIKIFFSNENNNKKVKNSSIDTEIYENN